MVQYRIGGELSVPSTRLKIRGGYGGYPSHMKDEPGFDKSVLSFGAGIDIGEQVRLDVAYARTSWNLLPYTVIWDARVQDESITASKLVVSFVYRI